jgi:hypothetical protein
MANPSTTLTLLRVIGEHEGEWGWYQLERAFPPGWFVAEPPDMRAMDLLRQLERDGLVTTTPGEPQRKFCLTDRGKDVLRQAAIDPLSV